MSEGVARGTLDPLWGACYLLAALAADRPASPTIMPFFDRESREQLKTAHRVGAVGIELVLATLVGWYGGQYLDGVFDTTPYLGYAGFAFGVFAGFRGLAYVVRRTDLDAM